jgi:hypothetical protein
LGFWTAWCALAQAVQLAGEDIRPLRALVDRATSAANDLGFPSIDVEAKVTRNVALALAFVAPQTPEQVRWRERAFELPLGQNPEELALAVAAFGFQADFTRLRQLLGRWHRARGSRPTTVIERLLVCQVESLCALSVGDFGGCQDQVRAGLATAEAFSVFPVNGTLLNYSAYAHLAVGEIGAAELANEDMLQVAGRQRLGLAAYHYMSARAALARGNTRLALEHAERDTQLLEAHGWAFARILSAQSRAEITWQLGELESATRILADAEALRASTGYGAELEAVLLGAAFAASGGNERDGDERLDAGLAFGARHGIVPFGGPTRSTLRALCRRAVERQIHSEYVAELVDKLALDLQGTASAPQSSLPEDFRQAVRSALRYLHEAHKLSANRLLTSRTIERRVGSTADTEARVGALQQALRSTIAELAHNTRTERMHRALLFAYVEPAGTQLLASERASMSFGSFRRHLASGIEEVALRLWMSVE